MSIQFDLTEISALCALNGCRQELAEQARPTLKPTNRHELIVLILKYYFILADNFEHFMHNFLLKRSIISPKMFYNVVLFMWSTFAHYLVEYLCFLATKPIL